MSVTAPDGSQEVAPAPAHPCPPAVGAARATLGVTQ